MEEIMNVENFLHHFKYIGGIVFFVILLIAIYFHKQCKGNLKNSKSNVGIPSVIYILAKKAYNEKYRKTCQQLIIANNYNVNYPFCKEGLSLFMCACLSGNCEIVEFMLKRGANIEAVNFYGDSPLYLAIYACVSLPLCSLDIIEMLIESGCNINAMNHSGYTSLHLAAAKGDCNLIHCLLKKGADPCISNSMGILPIHLAVVEGHKKAADILMNIYNKKNSTL